MQILGLGRAGDGDDVVSLSHEPRQRQAADVHALLLGDLVQDVQQLEVLGEVLRREPGHQPAEVAFREVVGGPVSTGQKTTTQGGVGDDRDAELTAGLEKRARSGVLDVHAEGAVLHLDGRDVVDLASGESYQQPPFPDNNM